ncbi:hypothetical protein GCM10010424_74210 [Streptomyces lienomycini]
MCRARTEPDTAREWLTWTRAGVEGLCLKRLSESYRPSARTWWKHKVRAPVDALVGAVTGLVTLLLGRYDRAGAPRYMGRTGFARPRGGGLARRVAAPPVGGVGVHHGVGQPRAPDVLLVAPRLVGVCTASGVTRGVVVTVGPR